MWWGKYWFTFLALLCLAVSGCAQSATHSLDFRTAGTQFEVAVPTNELAASDHDLQTYIENGAHAIELYFGHFPLKHVNMNIRAVGGDKVRFGRSSPVGGGTIMMLIGRDAKIQALDSDWTLTHEMVHLAFPATKGDNHDWLGEGMATYVEPIARAQAGLIPPREVWRQFVDYMPRGLPNSGDSGIDDAHGIGRVYWGGALFCLVADVEIRKQTHNRHGLEDAFRAIMRDGGTMEWEWDIDTIFETGDKATGTRVLEKLYRRWKDDAVEVDLEKLWHELGVSKEGDNVTFNDNAPEAAIRNAITQVRK